MGGRRVHIPPNESTQHWTGLDGCVQKKKEKRKRKYEQENKLASPKGTFEISLTKPRWGEEEIETTDLSPFHPSSSCVSLFLWPGHANSIRRPHLPKAGNSPPPPKTFRGLRCEGWKGHRWRGDRRRKRKGKETALPLLLFAFPVLEKSSSLFLPVSLSWSAAATLLLCISSQTLCLYPGSKEKGP